MTTKNMKRLAWSFVVTLGITLTSVLVIFSNRASAITGDDMYKNLMANIMFNCYNATEMASSVDLQEFASANNPEGAFRDYIWTGDNSGFHIPTYIGQSLGNNITVGDGTLGGYAHCGSIFLGGGGLSTGVFGIYGKTPPNPKSSNLGAELANIGYTEVSQTGASLVCIEGTYTKSTESYGGTKSAGSVCWRESELTDGTITEGWAFDQASSTSGGNGTVSISLRSDGTNYYIEAEDSETGMVANGSAYGFYGDPRAFIDRLAEVGMTLVDNAGIQYEVKLKVTTKKDSSQNFITRSISSYAWAYGTARNYLTGSSSIRTFSDMEKFNLYSVYLNQVYGYEYLDGGTCMTRSELASTIGGPLGGNSNYSNGNTAYTYKNGKWCQVYRPANKENHDNYDVSIFGSSSTVLKSYCDNVECLLVEIYKLDLPEDGSSDTDPGDEGGLGEGEMNCDGLLDEYAGGGIGAMQWILCPTMDNTAYTADWVDEITQNMLEIQANSYKGLDTTWGQVRNIANVLIIVFLLVVIFSQLTGRGIDNYGIKKMLPRIVVMAIIVNLSLYICQIAVDLSNIFGSGLRDMFGGMGGSPSGGAGYVTGAITGIFAAAASGGGAAAGAATTALAVGAAGWVAVVIAIIVLVLVIIVAVAILWLMVGVRQVIVIFCILISPLAFAAFILPNTQNLFKKWWELFKAALIIFPICGAVSGISAMIRNMVENGSIQLGTAGNLIVMVLPFLVFFLLPMLLKNAIAALGKVGGALTALGTSVRSGARNIGQSAVRAGMNTERFKTIQAETARRRQSESSQRTIDRLEALKKQREAEGGTLDEAQTRRLARAHETQRKLGLENQAARTILAERDYANLPPRQLIDRWEAAYDSGNTEEMDALTNVIASRGPGGVSDMAERLANKNIFDDNGKFVVGPNGDNAMERSFNALQANMLQNKTLATHMQNKAADAYQMVSSGGFGKDSLRHNMDYHTKYNDMATQIKDWATQSSSTLRRSAASGGLTSQMANDILNSKDPAIQSGILSDSGKKAALLAVANGYKGDWNDKDSINNFATQFEGGMDPNYINRSAESVADEAWAENARRSGANTGGTPNNNPNVDMNIDHSGNGADEIPE